jgi:hypothetical protein
MRQLLSIFGLILTTAAWGQWTEPDTTWCPQPGGGAQAPWISNDNLRLYLSGSAAIAVFSRPSPDSVWGPLTILPQRINLTPTQRCPAESPTGDTLYFIGDVRTDCESYGSYDVFYTVRTGPCDTCWGPVQNPGPDVNSSRREFSVGISRDGSTLLVASNRLGTSEADLYWHEKQFNGTWGPANHFGPEINDINEGEEHPCLSPDNNTLFFCHRNVMLGDIWVSRKINGQWQQAGPLPSPPNNWPVLSLDEDPCMSADGRTLWFRQADYTGYRYKIKVSVDTSIASVPSRPDKPTAEKPALSVSTDTSGAVRLCVAGLGLRGEHAVHVYDVLGRLVATQAVWFSLDGSRSSGFMSDLLLPSGAYVVSIQTVSGTLSAKYVRAK